MDHYEIAFTGNWPAALVALGALAAAAMAGLCYRARREELPRRSLAVLTALRTGALIVIAAFLLQPVLRLTRAERRRASVAVLVDVSESMGIRDAANDRSRLEAATALLARQPHALLTALARTHEVRLFVFGAVTQEPAAGEALESLLPAQKATALGEALKDVVKLTAGQTPSGIVLLTDGVSTRGEQPEQVAGSLAVPVFPVVLGGRVGGKGRFHDVGISRVPQTPQFIVNNEATLKAGLSHAGLEKFTDAERNLRLRLLEGDRELAARAVQFPATDGTLEAELKFVPDKVGLHRLTLTLDAVPEETVSENNARTFTVQVTDPRIRVLIVEGSARSEYRFLRRVLESDPNMDVTAVVKLSGSRFMVQGTPPGADLSRGLPSQPEDYGKFDVVILGDIARSEFAGVQLEYLKDFVSKGGALLALGGYHAFGAGGYADSALADVLPVTMGGEGDGHAEGTFVPVLTPAGRDHLAFSGTEEMFSGARPASLLDGANRVTGAKPGAEVLAVHEFERVGGRPMPVVAVQRYGAGRAMAVTADTTWKWKFQMEARGEESPYYRFWRQSVRWLAGRGEEKAPDRLVYAWPAQVDCDPGQTVTLRARVRNTKGEPEERAELRAHVGYPAPVRVTSPQGDVLLQGEADVRLDLVPLSLAEYQLSWLPPAEGLYVVSVSAELDGAELGTDRFEFVVGRMATEFDRVDVAEQTLRTLADQTGGSFYTEATAGRIADDLAARRAVVARRRELSLWNAPWLFAALLCCVTAEWILRKRKGLN
jgi:uncharacterized membrane protein